MPTNWKNLPGPENITRAVLPNGIVVLARSNFNSPSVSVSGYLACGSVFDPLDKLGLAHFTALCLMRGTQTRSFQGIYDTLESAGVSLGIGASVHNVNFGGRCLAEDLPMLLNLLGEILSQPSFPNEQVERLRAHFLTSLAIRSQDPDELAEMAFDEILFPNHPYGRPEDGYFETIQSITLEDLASFHQKHYQPSKMVIVVVGAVEPQQAIAYIQNTLGTWDAPSDNHLPEPPEISALQQTTMRHITVPGKFQTALIIGTHSIKRLSPDYMAVSLGNNILGQFGMMGRIGYTVREKSGLAYQASTGLNASIYGGSWEVSAGVNPANRQRAIDLIIDELSRFRKEKVTLEELQDSQASYIGRLPLSLESNSGVANALLNIERFQLGMDYYQRYTDQVLAVTPEAVLATAQKYWQMDRLAIVSAGPDIQD